MTRQGVLNAIYLIAACAVNTPAIGQFGIKNEAPGCVAANEFIELPPTLAGLQTDAYGKTSVALGSYERVSPDGRFVLRSFSGARLGEVSLMELPAPGAGNSVVKAFRTPLQNEAFPVQGTWRYLVNPNGDHYPLAQVLAQQQRARPVFRAGMTGFYAAASELPGSKSGHVRIRSFSWPNANGNDKTQGQGALSVQTVEVDVARSRVTQDSGAQTICQKRVREDGPFYSLPMISVDGEEFAALPQTPVQGQATMRIFGFGERGTGCEARTAFTFSTGKTIFGYPSKASAGTNTGADLAYEYKSQVWWYSRETGQAFNLAPYFAKPEQHQLLASAFPGVTRDGRIIYAATWKNCETTPCTEKAGYVIADPYQSNAYQNFLRQYKGSARRECVATQDVTREREAFARLHGLAN
jgi:hypothetical protein